MSVRRPLSGWKAAFEIRYDVASQDRREKELKEEEMGAVRVATMVVSAGIGQFLSNSRAEDIPKAARNTPSQMLLIITTISLMLGSLGSPPCAWLSCACWSPRSGDCSVSGGTAPSVAAGNPP
jgi:hypothetical protein